MNPRKIFREKYTDITKTYAKRSLCKRKIAHSPKFLSQLLLLSDIWQSYAKMTHIVYRAFNAMERSKCGLKGISDNTTMNKKISNTKLEISFSVSINLCWVEQLEMNRWINEYMLKGTEANRDSWNERQKEACLQSLITIIRYYILFLFIWNEKYKRKHLTFATQFAAPFVFDCTQRMEKTFSNLRTNIDIWQMNFIYD